MSNHSPSKIPDAQAHLATLRDLWPLVQQHDGSDYQMWKHARALRLIARRTAQRCYFGHEGSMPAASEDLLAILQDLQTDLTHNDGVRSPLVPGEWQQVVAQLSRVLPLVERLLAQ